MAVREESRVCSSAELFKIGAPAPERLQLQPHPDAAIFSSYVLTDGARRALAIINDASDKSHANLHWISDPTGAGKTHFLNYMLALEQRAPSSGAEHGRSATFAIEVKNAAEIESRVLGALAEALSSNHRNSQMWRGTGGAAGIKIALEHARRVGFASVTGVIDFDTVDSSEAAPYLASLAHAAAEFKHVRFSLVAASRDAAPEDAVALTVGSGDPDEILKVAVCRTRALNDLGSEIAPTCYRSVETGLLDPLSAFPFHPESLNMVRLLSSPPGTVAAIANLIRDVLISIGRRDRLIYPADLAAVPAVQERAEARLGASGTAALAFARRCLLTSSGNLFDLSEQLVETLVLIRACGNDDGISIRALMPLLPMLAAEPAGDLWSAGVVAQRLHQLARLTRGVIGYVADTARFDPGAADAPEVARFNEAIAFLRRFHSSLSTAADKAEMETQLAHLGTAMARALENSNRVRRVLDGALAEVGAQLTADSRLAFDDYCAMAGKGTRALIEVAADPERRDHAMRAIEHFDGLARAADMVPRIRSMREYLDGTGLGIIDGSDGAQPPPVATLVAERQLLAAELGPRILASPVRNLDAVEARFQKFKASYVHQYRSAHANWRGELERIRELSGDLHRHLGALHLLNRLAALGPAEGDGLSAAAATICRRTPRCEQDGLLNLDLSPRCPSCSYTLGMTLPMPQISDLQKRVGRALDAKLNALSHSAIARLIAENDSEHRLDGFLKIIQAAQTDVLVDSLDSRLADYLAHLLDENLGAVAMTARWPAQLNGPAAAKRRSNGTR